MIINQTINEKTKRKNFRSIRLNRRKTSIKIYETLVEKRYEKCYENVYIPTQSEKIEKQLTYR
jgi:hypothetical protein